MPTLHLNFVATIPVGHRIRATIYQRKAGRLSAVFTGEPRGYVIQDLDSGIEYSPGFLWQCAQEDEMIVSSSELEPNVVMTGTLQGTVTRCRVISRSGNARNHRITTVLEVQEETRG